jgi:HPt (histidine-containing phosphotransfer) domain-containing protein
MIEELRARFMQRFLDSARERLVRARAAIARDDARAIWNEMHALAGEAAIIGLRSVSAAARANDALARQWMESGIPAAAADTALRTIEEELAGAAGAAQ